MANTYLSWPDGCMRALVEDSFGHLVKSHPQIALATERLIADLSGLCRKHLPTSDDIQKRNCRHDWQRYDARLFECARCREIRGCDVLTDVGPLHAATSDDEPGYGAGV